MLANAEMEAFRAETTMEASDAALEAGPGMEAAAEAFEAGARREARDAAKSASGEEDHNDAAPQPRPPENLQRLQKILSQAGIASRRRAEEMIVAGRVIVNGQVVTTLGSKADPGRDHIRVDGKLLHGAERHRYFLLNKPRGFMTTLSDPEGRPTVMQFFDGMRERVYPVGRLDYQSEGLLLVTNDGELANLLTKAGSGVEKIYLVKVAGQPTEQELERLRSGVTIEREDAGSERVRTAPARVRQVRIGDNPWFEVVLIEGRNRELRKMFAAVGHFVEKIRRVGYGPLVLDVEPGKLRELTPDEVQALRLTASGKMKPRRAPADRMLPKNAGLTPKRPMEKRGARSGGEFGRRASGSSERRESGSFPRGESTRPSGERQPTREWRPRDEESRSRREDNAQRGERPSFGSRLEIQPFSGPKTEFEKRSFDRPRFDKPRFERPAGERGAGKPGGFRERPKFAGRKPFGGEKRPFAAGRPSSGPRREFDRPRFERQRPEKPGFDQPRFDRPKFDKPGSDKAGFEKTGYDRPRFHQPKFGKPRFEKPAFGGASRGPSEGRQENAPGRPFRPQGNRPGGFKRPSKPRDAGRPKPTFGGRPGGFKRPNKPGGAGGGRPRSGGERKRG